MPFHPLFPPSLLLYWYLSHWINHFTKVHSLFSCSPWHPFREKRGFKAMQIKINLSSHSTPMHSCSRKLLSLIPVDAACNRNAGMNGEANTTQFIVFTVTANKMTLPKCRQKRQCGLDSVFEVGGEGSELDSLKIWHKLSRESLIKSLEA